MPPQLIVALDTPDLAALEPLIATLSPLPVLFKSHWISFPSLGFAGLKRIAERTGDRLFLDFKLHDIPNTVKHSIRALLTRVPVRLLTIHAQGGFAMIQAARTELDLYADMTAGSGLASPPRLIAITLLTSLSNDDISRLGYPWKSRDEGVLHLARLAHEAGAHGVVCTAAEALMLREEFGDALLLVCPGIRPSGEPSADHALTLTPAEAAAQQLDYVVVGRPIYTAPDPGKAARTILRELGHVLPSEEVIA